MNIRLSCILAALIFFCGVVPSTAATDDSPFEINVILSLTGQGAFIGKTNRDLLLAFEDSVNKRGGLKGQRLHFAFADDETSPQVAVQLANGLVSKNVSIIMGPSITATCRAVMAVVSNGPLQYCLSPGVHPPKASYTYSVSVATSDLMSVDLRYFRDRGWKRVARLTTTDATGQDADENYRNFMTQPENRDFTTVADEHFNVPDLTVAAQIARIKTSQPQVMLLWCTGTPTGTALRAIKDAGLKMPVFVTNSNISVAAEKQYADLMPAEYYSAAPGFVANVAPSAGAKRAQSEYFAAVTKAGIPNDYTTGIAWDPALTIVDALVKLGPKATAQQLRDYINHLSKFSGISGDYNFTDGSQRGLGPDALMVMHYDPTKLAWNAVSAFGGKPR